MKRLNILIPLLVISGFIFTSCEDILDVKPEDKINIDQAFGRIEDFQYAVEGLYETLRRDDANNGYGYYQSFVLYPDIMSDNIIMNFDGRKTYQEQYTWKYNSTDLPSDLLWSTGYKAIHSANMILDRIDAFAEGTEDQRNAIKGEALAIRAMVHFDLVRYYAKPIHSASASDLGVPYMNKVDIGQPVRTPVIECYSMIEQDLLKAETLLNSLDSRGNNYFSVGAVRAMLARMYLTKKDYQKASDYAGLVISDPMYSLTNQSEFVAMWNDDQDVSGKEIILKLRCTENEGPRIGSLYGTTNSSEFVPTFEFYQMYTDEDVRKSTYFELTTIPSTGEDYNFIVKYNQRRGVEDGQNLSDMVILRLSEMYLIQAEALYELGDETGALADINLLRQNRYTPYIAGNETGNALEIAILHERRLELAFEGQRWFDLKRLDKDIVRDPSFGHLFDGTGVFSTSLYLSVTDNKRLWPIPESEINGNQNIKQNPGY